MKKILLTITAVAVVVVCQAQINQGTILIGASSNLSVMSESPNGGDSFTRFNMDVKGGYFFIDNLAGGLKLGYDKVDDFSELDFGVFGRYYIMGKFITGFGIASTRRDNGPLDASWSTISLEGGYAAFITESIAVEPTLNLDLLAGDYDATRFGLNVGFTVYLGRD